MKKCVLFYVLIMLLYISFIPQIKAEDNDSNWPKEIISHDGKIIIYQPQIESFTGNSLKSISAFSYTPKDQSEELFGAVWFNSKAEIDRNNCKVEIHDTGITNVRLTDKTADKQKLVYDILYKNIGNIQFSVTYDHLLASLNSSAQQKKSAVDINTAPPEIIFKTVPAILITIAGEPELRLIGDSGIKKVINTPFFIVHESKSGVYYLNGGTRWFSTESFKNKWTLSSNVPEEIIEVYNEDQRIMDALTEKPAQIKDNRIPEIIITTEPAELIVSDGKPVFSSVTGGDLLYMSNSESDIFIEVATQNYFIVLSGRWFRSKSMNGPWEFVRSDRLPSAFSKIPENSVKGHVLAFVAGTDEAKEAVIDSQIPQTAAIKRSDVKLTVTYDGDPRFRPVPKTSIYYAINSTQTVLRINDKYYCCDNAVWFVSDNPSGPWIVADRVPDEVQSIPPESPCYNVKYVYIYDSTPDIVYVGYTPGYQWCFPYYGTVVYGTGFYYSPWIGHHCYPHPMTWGFHANYDPWTGWCYGMSWSSGWMVFGIGFGYYPGWWGPEGYRWRPNRHHHREIPVVHRPRHVHGDYRNDSIYRKNNIYEDRKRIIISGKRSIIKPKDSQIKPFRDKNNNVYTDKKGNVYRRDNNGARKVREQGKWKADIQSGNTDKNEQDNLKKEHDSRKQFIKKQTDKNDKDDSVNKTDGNNRGDRGDKGGRNDKRGR